MGALKRKIKTIPKELNIELFFSKILATDNGCWEWMSRKNTKGYGVFCSFNGDLKAHRISFHIFNGELDNDKVIDHTCMNKSCVNPKHLRQVTQRTNCLENSKSPLVRGFLKEKCIRGHVLPAYDNIKKRRLCLECVEIRKQKTKGE